MGMHRRRATAYRRKADPTSRINRLRNVYQWTSSGQLEIDIKESAMKVNLGKTFLFACSMAGAVVVTGAISLLAAPRAAATAQFAKDTGKSCGDCHSNASGGGALTPFGEKFKANGNKMPK